MQIRDANYRQNALIVSVICGLMETFTISNYDNTVQPEIVSHWIIVSVPLP